MRGLIRSPGLRRELIGLVAAGVLSGLVMLAECVARGQNPAHASRALVPAAALIVVVLVLNAFAARRDRTLLIPVALLCGLSIALLWRLDGFLAAKQVVWVGIGCLMLVATFLVVDDTERLRSASTLAGIAAVALLAVTMVWGQEKNGARLWLGIPGVAMFQPGEIAKVLIVMFLAGLLTDYRERPHRARSLLPIVALLALGIGLALVVCVGQRDLGAALLLGGVVFFVTYMATGAGGATVMAGLFLAVAMAVVLGPRAAKGVPGAAVLQRRMQAWVDPWEAPQGAGYQTIQALLCFAHGGVVGAGPGLGTPQALPVSESDMIYAVAGEDLGFAGCAALVLLYALIAWRGFQIALAARGTYPALLAAGLSTFFCLQTFVILGGVLRVLPLTGVTLPFLSYGGSSMVGNFIALGLLLCVSRDCVEWEHAGRRGRGG